MKIRDEFERLENMIKQNKGYSVTHKQYLKVKEIVYAIPRTNSLRNKYINLLTNIMLKKDLKKNWVDNFFKENEKEILKNDTKLKPKKKLVSKSTSSNTDSSKKQTSSNTDSSKKSSIPKEKTNIVTTSHTSPDSSNFLTHSDNVDLSNTDKNEEHNNTTKEDIYKDKISKSNSDEETYSNYINVPQNSFNITPDENIENNDLNDKKRDKTDNGIKSTKKNINFSNLKNIINKNKQRNNNDEIEDSFISTTNSISEEVLDSDFITGNKENKKKTLQINNKEDASNNKYNKNRIPDNSNILNNQNESNFSGVYSKITSNLRDEIKKIVRDEIKELDSRLDDYSIKIEKNEGKWERQQGMNDSMQETIGNLREDIGSMRSTVTLSEKNVDKMSMTFEKMKDLLEDITPEKIQKRFEKLDQKNEMQDANIEKNQTLYQKTSKDLKQYLEIMSHIKNYNNLFNVLKDIKAEHQKVLSTKQDVNRIASKVEEIFKEVNNKLIVLDEDNSELASMKEVVKDVMNEVTQLEIKLNNLVTIDKFDNEVVKIKNNENNITKMDNHLVDLSKDMLKLEKYEKTFNEKLKQINNDIYQFKVSKLKKDSNVDFNNNKKEIIGSVIDERKKYLDTLLNELNLNIRRKDFEDAVELSKEISKIIKEDSEKKKLDVEIQRFSDLYKKLTDQIKERK